MGKSRKFWMIAAVLCMLCLALAQPVSAAGGASSAKKVYGGKWTQTAQGRKYCYSKTKYAKDGWRSIKGKVYYFNAKGICRTGWFTQDGARYYANKKGQVCMGKWAVIKNKRYYFAKNGKLQTNRFIKSGNKYYYVNSKGVNVTSKWVTHNGKRYFLDRYGARLQGTWLKYNNQYYYLEEDGVMAVSKYIGSHYVGADGVRTTPPEKTEDEYIFVGDSRTVGMELAHQSGDTKYIAKVSMGYSWLSSTADRTLKGYLEENPYATVIFAFGINDLGNIQHYISYYRTMMQQYPLAEFYVMSVNPVKNKVAAAHGYKVKNSQIKAFNRQMKAAFGAPVYIDTYQYLTETGIVTNDGIHYDLATYSRLYDFVMGKIK